MTMICYILAIFVDPGKVSASWISIQDDQVTSKRRYCFICHLFKPDRCHHCTTCKRCVLCMDHHCPWINNCIGAKNKKIFILMLLYINLTVIYEIIFGFTPFLEKASHIINNSKWEELLNFVTSFGIFAYIGLCIFFFVIANFLKYHL